MRIILSSQFGKIFDGEFEALMPDATTEKSVS
jgi:hypothetical protein